MELPPPAISVSGEQGYTMWFSLSQPVPLEQAEAFLSGVRAQFLAELPAHHVLSCPSPEGALTAPLTPALHAVSGRWSVYIDPRLGGMFVEQCGLEIPPNMDHQAELLSGLKSIESNDFQRVLRSLGAHEAARAPRSNSPAVTGNKNAADPHAFLQDVMNDPAVPLKLRIKAAKALLPYVNR
jgi:hypothetical protein